MDRSKHTSQESLSLECYLQLKQSQKLVSQKFVPTEIQMPQGFPKLYYDLNSINILIPLGDENLEALDSLDLEMLVTKLNQDPHRSWLSFFWIVPDGYQETFDTYLNLISQDLEALENPKSLKMNSSKDQILDLSDLQEHWSILKPRVDGYWNLNETIGSPLISTAYLERYTDIFRGLPKIGWQDDQPLTAELYQALIAHVEALDREASQAFAQGDWATAIDRYQATVCLNPLNSNNWANLGSTVLQTGEYLQAKEYLEQAIALNPSNPQYFKNLGIIYVNLQQPDRAVMAYKQAMYLNPQTGDSYCDLGNLFAQLSQYEAAKQVYQEGLKIDPWHYGLHLNLGNLLVLTKRNTEAIQVYKKARFFRSNNSDLYLNLSIAHHQDPLQSQYYYAKSLQEQGQYQEALSLYENIIQINPFCPSLENPEVLVDAISCLKILGCDPELLFSKIKAAISIVKLSKPIAAINLRFIRRLLNHLNDKGDHHQAQSLVLEMNLFTVPEFNDLFSQLNLPILYQDQSEIIECRKRFTVALEAICTLDLRGSVLEEGYALAKALINFYISYQNFNDLYLQKLASQFIRRVLTQKIAEPSQSKSKPNPIQTLAKPNKINVGFFSSYVQAHSASSGVLGWLSHHNTEKFEYSIYHFGEVLDTNTAKFASASEHFHHICLQDFPDVAQWLDRVIETVQDHPLDIIVFTDVGMDIKSTLLARLRLAPVQCVLWGHPVTTGSEVIDYFLTADLMEPDDAPDHYSEQLVHLPNISWSYPQVGLPEQQTKRSDFQ
ncbi:MAG: hypothetical protein RLZZ435_3342, partial [Cyanobacteriota bacterium]